jgi:hypothetical protein
MIWQFFLEKKPQIITFKMKLGGLVILFLEKYEWLPVLEN